MSTLKSNVIEPATGTDLSLGASGDLIDVSSDTLQLNTLKDSGGNTLFVSDGSGNLSSINSALDVGGGPNLILSQTASSSATVNFTANIDNTYNHYMFVFVNIRAATSLADFTFQGSINAGSSYNTAMTTTYYRAYHKENDGAAALGYDNNRDQHQGTGYQQIMSDLTTDADAGSSGVLHLFLPSSTTYQKHFYSRTSNSHSSGGDAAARDIYVTGYFNTTSAINAMSFKMDSGNITDGKIKMYGCR